MTGMMNSMPDRNTKQPKPRSALERALSWPMHESTRDILKFFAFDHLSSGKLRDTSERCSALAVAMVSDLSGPELTFGLRQLLIAKDAFVRAALAEID